MNAWLPWALLSAVLAAATALTAKVGLQGVDSNTAAFYRVLILVPVLAAVVVLTRGSLTPPAADAKTWTFLTLSALATGGSWLAYFRALQLGPASRVAPVDKLSVVFVAVLAALLLAERLPPLGWAGVGMIAGGAALLAIA